MEENRESTKAVEPDEAGYAALIKEVAVSSFLCLFGIFLIVFSLKMPTDELTSEPGMFYAAPGLFPLIAGVGIFALSLLLAIKYLCQIKKEYGASAGKAAIAVDKKALLRLLTAAVLLALYVFVGLGRLPYYLSTFLYLSLTMLIFRKDKMPIWVLIVISVAASLLISYLFGTLARIPLP